MSKNKELLEQISDQVLMADFENALETIKKVLEYD